MKDTHNINEPIIRRRNDVRSSRRRDGLIRFASNVTSQSGEDGILRRIFQEIDRGRTILDPHPLHGGDDNKNPQRRRHVVDVGAWDGKHLSNTYSLFFPPASDGNDDSSDGMDEAVAASGGNDCAENDDDALELQQQSPKRTVEWTGILIEANPERFKELQQLHGAQAPTEIAAQEVVMDVSSNDDNNCCTAAHSQHPICLCRCVSGIPHSPDGLDAILRQHGPTIDLPYDFDFLCIDVDGSDYHLWKNLLESDAGSNGFDKGDAGSRCRPWRPKVVCIEFNPTMPNDLVYIPPVNDSMRHGASLAALVELGLAHDYVLVETTLYNAIFVTETLYETTRLKELVPDTSIEALHEVTMGTALYQLYDGTIKLHGCKKLLWHRVPIVESRLQVLPTHQRHFPFAPPPAERPASASTPSALANGSARHRPPSTIESVETPSPSTWDESTPVVDVSSWCCATTTECDLLVEHERRECSRQLLETLLKQGFGHVRGTGMCPELCRHALEVSRQFLHEIPESVRKTCLAKDRARRGYSPPGTENFASLVGETAPNDVVRKFRIGPTGNDNAHLDPTSMSSLLQPNVWPDPADWDGAEEYRSVMEEYYNEANRAATAVVQAICAGLLEAHPDLEESLRPLLQVHNSETNDELHGDDGGSLNHPPSDATTSILTVLGYSVGSRHKSDKRSSGPLVAAHTDVGVLTFLLFDAGTCATLQRFNGDASNSTGRDPERWVDVCLPNSVPSHPVFVVNVADCLSELSDGRLPSTLHRVAAQRGSKHRDSTPPLAPRTCCAMFVGLQPHQSLLIRGERMTYEEWRKQRIARALRVLKAT